MTVLEKEIPSEILPEPRCKLAGVRDKLRAMVDRGETDVIAIERAKAPAEEIVTQFIRLTPLKIGEAVPKRAPAEWAAWAFAIQLIDYGRDRQRIAS